MMRMIDLGASSTRDSHIKDVKEATFAQDVIEASQTQPIIVDFWAPWCGPCKTLGPILEKIVSAAGGAVKMVKINVDKAQTLAAQLRIQSIPTVYAFFKGQPIDGFQGAVKESEIKAFIDRVIESSGGQTSDSSLDDMLVAAEELLSQGAVVDATQKFAEILSVQPSHAGAYSGLVRAQIAVNEIDKAEAILNGAPAEITDTVEMETAYAQLQLAQKAQNVGPLSELREKMESEPDNLSVRFDVSQALYASGATQEAVDELLEIFRRDSQWNDEAAKKELLTIFDALKSDDPVVLKGRRKLSSIMFA